MTHALKCWPQSFWDVATGLKSFELRRRDRPYAVGDTLLLQEWDPALHSYTGKETRREIRFIYDGGQFGVDAAYCVLGFAA